MSFMVSMMPPAMEKVIEGPFVIDRRSATTHSLFGVGVVSGLPLGLRRASYMAHNSQNLTKNAKKSAIIKIREKILGINNRSKKNN